MYIQRRALCISTKEPYVYPEKSPMYTHKRSFHKQKQTYRHNNSPVYINKRAVCISKKEPYAYPQKSPMYIQKRALCIPTKEASINRSRPTDTTTALYISTKRAVCISTKEPDVHPQKSSIYIHKRAIHISKINIPYETRQKTLYKNRHRSKETYKRDLQKRPTKETYINLKTATTDSCVSLNRPVKETYKRVLYECKETCKRDL